MAQFAIAAAGAYVGNAFIAGTILGMTGAQIGWMAGSLLGSMLAPTQKAEGPRLTDLRVQGTEYGQAIPWVAGAPRLAGQIIWASEKHETENTEEAGKGGGGSEYTTYTYDVDLLIMLTENEIDSVSRVWSNGELIWGGTATLKEILGQVISEILGTEKENVWNDFRVYTGRMDQLPDPMYEAAVGVGNAPAYRGRSYVAIQGLQLGNSGVIPNLTFEVNGVAYPYAESAVKMLYSAGSDNDQSIYDWTRTAPAPITVNSDGVINVPENPGVTMNLATNNQMSLQNGDLTVEFEFYLPNGLEQNKEYRLCALGAYFQVSLEWVYQPALPRNLIYFRSETRPYLSYSRTYTPTAQAIAELEGQWVPYILMRKGNRTDLYFAGKRFATHTETGTPDSATLYGNHLVPYSGTTGAFMMRNLRISFRAMYTFNDDPVGTPGSMPIDWSPGRKLTRKYATTDADNINIGAFNVDSVAPTFAYTPKTGTQDFTFTPTSLTPNFATLSSPVGPALDFWQRGSLLSSASTQLVIPNFTTTNDKTFEVYVYIDSSRVGSMGFSTANIFRFLSEDGSTVKYSLGLRRQNGSPMYGFSYTVTSTTTNFVPQSFDAPTNMNQWIRIVFTYSRYSNITYIFYYINNTQYYSGQFLPYPDQTVVSGEKWKLEIGGTGSTNTFPGYISRIRLFSDTITNEIIATGQELNQIKDASVSQNVAQLLERAGYDPDEYFDTTELDAVKKPLRAMAISQISSTRTPLEVLQSAFFFEASKSDKLYVFPRRSTSLVTIPYADLGTANDVNGADEPLSLNVGNELEVPAQIAISYNNMSQDYNTGTEHSDRLLSSQESLRSIQMPLGMYPAEAKGVVDAMLWDSIAGLTKTTISLPLKYAYLEPGDIITLTDQAGALYRVRILTKRDTLPILTFECSLDDVAALDSAEITDQGYESVTEVVQIAPTIWQALDIPILRDADDAPGYYFALCSDLVNASDEWKGAVAAQSWDDVAYEQLYTTSVKTVMGDCTTILGNWTGGNVFDETNTLTVVMQGQLSSAPRADMLLDLTINAMLVGSEIIRFRTATLITSSTDGEYTYRLSSLIRGQRGTEWAINGHGSDERCVLLDTRLRRITSEVSQLNVPRYVKAVTFNKLLSSATGELFSDTGVGLRPFSPANPNALEDAGDLVVTWQRRTRRSYRYGGATPTVPLGEASEKYRVKVYDGLTLVRTTDVTAETWTYTGADITSDGFSSGATINFEIMQLSEIIGEGYAATTEGIAP